MSSHRRRRPERSRAREWTPDHYWPEDQGWPDDRRGAREDDDEERRYGRVPTVVTFLVAALFVAGLGVYGIARQHHATAAALQESASGPCARQAGAAAARCRSSARGGVTDGSGRPATATPGGVARPGHSGPARTASASPRPAPSTHAPATPAPPATPTATAAPTPDGSASPPPSGLADSAATQVLALINQARAQAGLPAMAISFGLDTSSLGHTTVMAAGCGLSHQCPAEPALGARLTAAGVTWTSAGENVGEGGPEPNTTSAIAAMAVGLTQDMLNEKPPDDGHRLNILSSSFHHIGIYVLRDSNGTVWMTQDFSS